MIGAGISPEAITRLPVPATVATSNGERMRRLKPKRRRSASLSRASGLQRVRRRAKQRARQRAGARAGYRVRIRRLQYATSPHGLPTTTAPASNRRSYPHRFHPHGRVRPRDWDRAAPALARRLQYATSPHGLPTTTAPASNRRSYPHRFHPHGRVRPRDWDRAAPALARARPYPRSSGCSLLG